MMERPSELANGLGVGSRVEVARTVQRARLALVGHPGAEQAAVVR
jgi:hypothetical protein